MEKQHFGIQVACYVGYQGEEIPGRFYLGRRRVEILEVVDRWLAPDHRYFKVAGDDDAVYILRHDALINAWGMTLFLNRRSLALSEEGSKDGGKNGCCGTDYKAV